MSSPAPSPAGDGGCVAAADGAGRPPADTLSARLWAGLIQEAERVYRDPRIPTAVCGRCGFLFLDGDECVGCGEPGCPEESPSYGPGNPDFERDFARELEP